MSLRRSRWGLAAALSLGCARVVVGDSPAPTVAPLDDRWRAEPAAPESVHVDRAMPSDCPVLPGTAKELAETPRANAEFELMALALGGGFTADSATYDRLRRDIPSIRAHRPVLKDVTFRGAEFPDRIELAVTTKAFDAIEARTYHDWDCLHARYGWIDGRTSASGALRSVTAQLFGRFRRDTIEELYQRLPGVEYASFGGGFDGSTICAKRAAEDTFHYVFDVAGGDCPAGCIEHHEYYFVSSADGFIEARGDWDSTSGAPAPEWEATYGRFGFGCR